MSLSSVDPFRTGTPSSAEQIEIESDEESAEVDAKDKVEDETLQVLGPLGLLECLQVWNCSQG